MFTCHQFHSRVAALLTVAFVLPFAGCSTATYEPKPVDGRELTRRIVARRALIVSAPEATVQRTLEGKHDMIKTLGRDGDDLLLGTATPVSKDGYFLTAKHVVGDERGRGLLVMTSGNTRWVRARIVWKGLTQDIALVKADLTMPGFYSWTPRHLDLPQGLPVAHGGFSTGADAGVGRLIQRVPGRGGMLGAGNFLHTSRVAEGDSGGPIFASSGELIGISIALRGYAEMDTRFFISSQGLRPDPLFIEKRIAADRRRK